MSSKIKIGIGKAKESAGKFIKTWHDAEKGRVPKVAEEFLLFEDLETLLSALTPRRWALLKVLRHEGPMSVRALAKQLRRDYKNVHVDVNTLENLGLITRTKDSRVKVPWETIIAEMKLAA